MVKIIVYEDYVDFEAPISMTIKQQEKFISFMKKIFGGIETKEVEEVSRKRGNFESYPKKWAIDEYVLLITPSLSNENISEKLKRSVMSIRMKRGYFVSDFMIWAKKKGYLVKPDKKLVEEFLKEEGEKNDDIAG